MTAPPDRVDESHCDTRTILIVDDFALYRDALSAVLSSQGFGSVHAVGNLSSLVVCLESAAPRLILLNMGTVEVPSYLRAIASLAPEKPMVAIGSSEVDEELLIAYSAAAVTVCHRKSDSLADLVASIKALEGDCAAASPKALPNYSGRVSGAPLRGRPPPAEPVLTVRETQVLRMLELGKSNQDIATQLSIAVHTVKNHVHSVLIKLGVSNRTQAAALSKKLHLGQENRRRTGSGPRKNWPGRPMYEG